MKPIIIDANLVSQVFRVSRGEHTRLREALLTGSRYNLFCVLGGHLRVEYRRLRSFLPIFSEMSRSGRLKFENDVLVNDETTHLEGQGILVSNDAHIIALARVSGARILCSKDKALHTDFTNVSIVTPRGRVYQCEDHCHLFQ